MSLPPPADLRCQIYADNHGELIRCTSDGTHWEKWGGCSCSNHESDVCEGDFFSWECSGDHEIAEGVAA